MWTHAQVWEGIDALAARNGLSASGLARKSGLDATSFNPSKRIGPDGRARWPSTESIAKIMAATGASISEFVSLITKKPAAKSKVLPLLGFAQAGAGGFFDDGGFPQGSGWDEIDFPDTRDEKGYALQVTGDSMTPLYRDGDILIISPNSTIRRGDRVVVKTVSGEVLAKELKRRTDERIELLSYNPAHPIRSIDAKDVAWIARIIWTSQ